MESLRDLLLQKNLDEPTEIVALRKYYEEMFDETPEIKISGSYIVIHVPNGKVATELRMRQPEIERRCQLTKKLFIKIRGSKGSSPDHRKRKSFGR